MPGSLRAYFFIYFLSTLKLRIIIWNLKFSSAEEGNYFQSCLKVHPKTRWYFRPIWIHVKPKKRAVFKGGIDISAGPFKEQRSSRPIKTMLPFAYSRLIKISLNGFEKIRKPIFKTRLWGGVRRTRQMEILAALWCCHLIKMLIGEVFHLQGN